MTLRRDPGVLRAWRARRVPLRAVSPRRRVWQREYRAARLQVRERADGLCEARLAGCGVWGTECHHIAGRVGAHANALSSLLWVCRSCHDLITRHAVPDYDLGLSRSRHAKSDSGPDGERPAVRAGVASERTDA